MACATVVGDNTATTANAARNTSKGVGQSLSVALVLYRHGSCPHEPTIIYIKARADTNLGVWVHMIAHNTPAINN